MSLTTRRGFLFGAGATIAVVSSGMIMPIKKVIIPKPFAAGVFYCPEIPLFSDVSTPIKFIQRYTIFIKDGVKFEDIINAN